jgi:putative nucleotidyltransferase with HDIG domain
MTREEALALVQKMVKTKNLVKHMLAVEAGMRALAAHLGEDKERWALAGLLHDLDYEETKDRPDLHGYRTVAMLKERGFTDEEILNAILAHAGHKDPEKPMEIGLTAVDPLTGLIVAAALVHPEKARRAFRPKRPQSLQGKGLCPLRLPGGYGPLPKARP